ncbi:thymidine phosphorylase [Cognatishimia activa]|uniref:Thymidine phosphorylase n=1 Tax=Cognatishimia activa TaxID=1715691 RepID=A0A0P1IQB5_9RHOB|nr:thymidine phosphorylase [Cognatishimia activa]CUJ09942.1 Thymidine phosphorylase [Cognatishimia activa]CUK25723.1 Thymidine phosphorylase [Cognatishimia activa]
MDARAIIAGLRAGQVPSESQLSWFAQGLADQSVSDAQAGAFAMAVCLNGLTDKARADLTLAMRDSGDTLQWNFDGPIVDKHSTGGVGDCVSLVLAPALAACGAYVPMISGRGLGHTGGTLDKMESIPGLKVDLSENQFRQVVGEAGAAIVSASANIAPADKRLYAIRDVTATVESLDLITASILSKKLAGGLEHLVLDVKTGSGAFMKSVDDARALATSLVKTANLAGCPTSAIISDMNEPLAPSLGNALEIAEVMAVLCEGKTGPLLELSCALGGVLLNNAGLAKDVDIGAQNIAAAVQSGKAAEAFGKMVYAQGGPVEFAENWRRFLPEATVIREIKAPRSGVVTAIDGQALGLTVVGLGGGRQVESDIVDPAVGLSDVVRLGDKVVKGQPLLSVHASREDEAAQAAQEVLAAISIGDEAQERPALIHERIDA